ncbi:MULTISPECIES: sporulation membrane protein YtaF [Paenibacillus]|uniref:sporulation membrane protein YtaF n=1 Tax=Paenibacillus TaxID=44249 RepID=UPI0022B90721|nr:sporulation membrane protein YtaF [Paenibacillus caseinilyticus]MCZ8518319.1 sporulation membrane protein YtaF [Paenibacillus caseinilyticus]
MLPGISLLLLALAVSLDGFGVGVTYGLRRIRIPLLSIAIIAACSGGIIYVSMGIGVLLRNFVDPAGARMIGAVILIGIGIWALVQMLRQRGEEDGDDEGEEEPAVPAAAPTTAKEIVYIELKRFGLVIQILRTPQAADVDRSGNISAYEATLLGVALSLDAFGAGVGAALLGFTPWLTAAVIAVASGTFLAVGLRIGYRYAGLPWVRKLAVLPGFVLIVMGIMKLL